MGEITQSYSNIVECQNTHQDDHQSRAQSINLYKEIILSTFQIAIGYICLDINLAITLHYTNKYYSTPIQANAIGLTYTIIQVIIQPLSLGLNQSLNNHVSQALGQKNTHLAIKYLYITIFSHLLYFLPLSITIYLLKQPFSILIDEDAELTADQAWIYIIPLLISTIFAIQFACLKSYLIACKIFTPFIYIHLVTTAGVILWCYLFIIYLDMSIRGAGISVIITEILNCVLLLGYILISKSARIHFKGFNIILKVKLRLVISYWKNSIPMIIHIYADIFVFCLLTFLALGLGSTSVNSQLALSNTSTIYFKIPLSLSLVLMTFIGRELSTFQIENAKRCAVVGMIIFGVFATIVLMMLWFMRSIWAIFYAYGKQAIEEQLLETLPYFILGCIILDGIQGTLTGILKGINKVNVVTYSTLISYYIIGIPIICLLVLQFNWGVIGIWLGFGFANGILVIFYIVLVIQSDWNQQALQIEKKFFKQDKLQLSSIQVAQL